MEAGVDEEPGEQAASPNAVGGAWGRFGWGWPASASVALSAVFVARTSFDAQGQRHFSLFDDALISMRYAQNLADGHGLVWNEGERVEGYTNLLWTLWMAVAHLLPLPDRAAPLVVAATAAVLLGLLVVLVGMVARRLDPGRPSVAVVAMWATALYYPLLFWSVRGLEPGLLAVLTAAAALLALRVVSGTGRRDVVLLALVIVAALLTRTDAAVMVAVVVGFLAWHRRWFAVRWAVVATVATLGAHTAFRILYYGDAVPLTATLKLDGTPVVERLTRGALAAGNLALAELGIVVALALVALGARRARPPAPIWLPVGILGASLGYSVWVGGDAWEFMRYANRFVAPAVPLVLVVAVMGIADLAAQPRRSRLLAAAAGAAVAVGVVLVDASIASDRGGWNLRAGVNIDRVRSADRVALVLAIAALSVVAIEAVLSRHRQRISRVAEVAGGVFLVALVSATPWIVWRGDAGYLVDEQNAWARFGVFLGDTGDPDATIAVVTAGGVGYWSGLEAFDILGKNDPVIARSAPRLPRFFPGHNKWDYRHSVCELRPDLVTELWMPEPEDIETIWGCGYDRIAGPVHIRRDSTSFSRAELERFLTAE